MHPITAKAIVRQYQAELRSHAEYRRLYHEVRAARRARRNARWPLRWLVRRAGLTPAAA